jgi:hypothetical protein
VGQLLSLISTSIADQREFVMGDTTAGKRFRSDQAEHRPNHIRYKLDELQRLVDAIVVGGEGCEKAETYENVARLVLELRDLKFGADLYSKFQRRHLHWVQSDSKTLTALPDLVRARLQEFKDASSYSSPVCLRCGGRGHLARYCRSAFCVSIATV